MIWSVRPWLINVTDYARPLYGPTWLICIRIGADHRVLREWTSFGTNKRMSGALHSTAAISTAPSSYLAKAVGYLEPRTIVQLGNGNPLINDTEANLNSLLVFSCCFKWLHCTRSLHGKVGNRTMIWKASSIVGACKRGRLLATCLT